MTFIDTLYNASIIPPMHQQYFTKNISSDIRNIKQWDSALPLEDIKTVCDLTGNVGTESLYFSRTLPNLEHTDIYEIDKDTYTKLLSNIATLPQSLQDKIYAHNATSENVTNFYNLILFDPPWGGSNYTQGKKEQFDEYRKQLFTLYKSHSTIYPEQPIDTVELQIGNKTVREVILQSAFGVLALKIPLNAQESPFANDFKPIKVDKIKSIYIPIVY